MTIFSFDRVLASVGLARFSRQARLLLGDATDLAHFLSDRAWAGPADDDATADDDPGLIDLASPPAKLGSWPTGWRPQPERLPPPPGGLPELRRAIADLHGERTGHPFDADHVGIFAGASGAFAAAAEALVNPGDAVVLFEPTSPLFLARLRQRRATIRWVATTVEAGRVRFDRDELGRALPDAKWLVLADPVNPTGGRFDRRDLDDILTLAERRRALVWLDRAYVGECPEVEADYWPVADHLVTCESLNHCGTRVGACVGRPALVRVFRRMAEANAAIPPAWSQRLALAVLAERASAPASPLLTDFAAERLKRAGLAVADAGGPFVWAELGSRVGSVESFLRKLRHSARVAAAPGSRFGPNCGRFVRLTVNGDEGRTRTGINRLVEAVAEGG